MPNYIVKKLVVAKNIKEALKNESGAEIIDIKLQKAEHQERKLGFDLE